MRGPEGFVVPQSTEGNRATAEVIVFHARSQPEGELRLDKATQVAGRWVVPATVPLQTSSSQKFLRVYFNQDYNELFPLPLRSRPHDEDFEWSAWVEAGWPVDQPKPAPEATFRMRYRVQIVEPPPSGPTDEEVASRAAAEDEAKFRAVAVDAPIASWLPYTRYGTSEARLKTAVERITRRKDLVAELSSLILSQDPEVRVDALRGSSTWIDRPPRWPARARSRPSDRGGDPSGECNHDRARSRLRTRGRGRDSVLCVDGRGARTAEQRWNRSDA